MQKTKRLIILVLILLFVLYFSWTSFMFISMFYSINEEVIYLTSNSKLIMECIFVFSLPILGILSITYNFRIFQSLTTKNSNEILDETRTENTYKNYFLLNIYFVFSIILILQTSLRIYNLFELINEVEIYISYLRTQAIILFVIISIAIIFLIDTIKLRKKHIKS